MKLNCVKLSCYESKVVLLKLSCLKLSFKS